ncbi:helix-turn-helix domain-containing protein [Pseudahrensia aquimaris]|uniref:Helix-turn-helix domain-containing protein n=1 Tax=Pseudahrensia aquimaris TaxID=744461 RepID=A0ABW3FFU2_9HYPH
MGFPAEQQSHDAAHAEALGNDVRALRKSKNLTLNELALRVGRSVGFISQVERGLSSPSIDDLRSIASALGVPTSWFFMSDDVDPRERGVIVRAGGRRSLGTRESGIVEELLSPDLGGAFEMFRSEFQPGAEMMTPILRETEEAGYVVSGRLDLWIEDEMFELNAGDTFRFDHKPYRWRNPGEEPTVLIWTVSPPVY